jgi:hypothetical protein
LNFRQLIAQYATGKLEIYKLPETAVKGLEEGFDSPSLCILAGLDEADNSYEGKQYFELALGELNITIPGRREAALQYAFGIVDDILAGNRDVFEGTSEIRYAAIDSFDFFEETKEYYYDSVGFEKAYGLFVTIDELSDAISPWKEGKTNEQLISETREELLQELKRWKTKEKTFYNISHEK